MNEGVQFKIPKWEEFVNRDVTETNQLLLLTAVAILTEITGQDEQTVWNVIVGMAAMGVDQINKEYNV